MVQKCLTEKSYPPLMQRYLGRGHPFDELCNTILLRC